MTNYENDIQVITKNGAKGELTQVSINNGEIENVNTTTLPSGANELNPLAEPAATGQKNIISVDEASSVSSGNNIYINQDNKLMQIDYDTLATAILNKLSTQSFNSLNTSSKLVLDAINELNGKMIPRELKTLSDVLVYAESMQHPKVEFFECSGSQYTGNFPNIHYNYGTGFILKRNAASMSVIAFPESNQYRPIINSIKSGSWEGWKYFDGTSAQ